MWVERLVYCLILAFVAFNVLSTLSSDQCCSGYSLCDCD